jgi:dihydrofolate synthase / folylpolyglutamate synthase
LLLIESWLVKVAMVIAIVIAMVPVRCIMVPIFIAFMSFVKLLSVETVEFLSLFCYFLFERKDNVKVEPIKTEIVEPGKADFASYFERWVPKLPERSVLAVSSKIVALFEGRTIPLAEISKKELVRREADRYLPHRIGDFDLYLTIKNSMLIPSAGVDESNSDGNYILWPADPQGSTERIWRFLERRFPELKGRFGVLLTDSTPSPLRWGVGGKSIGFCGFRCLNSKVGESDLFGRKLEMTRIHVADGLAAAAVLCMGEGSEGTPMAMITDLPFVEFTGDLPTEEEKASVKIDIEDDLFGPLLMGVDWKG